jgi:UDP-glucuronate decarboxylase
MNKRVLVTGGAGFLGVNLCKALAQAGNSVWMVDNLSSGNGRCYLNEVLKGLNIAFVPADVTEEGCFGGGPDAGLDEIYNLACTASPLWYQKDPVETIKSNILGSIHALEEAHLWGAKILQTSTSEVYGDPLVSPQPEEYWGNVNPISLRSPYDEGKRCAEALYFAYHRQYGTDIKIMRIFNTYGPHMRPDDGRVVSNFIMQALRGDPITMHGDGKHTRSFCYVDDTIAGMMLMMERGGTGPINFGNPEAYVSMLELAEMIKELTDSRSEFQFVGSPEDDPKIRRPDIAKAKALGWEPKVNLKDGLIETINYFRRFTR